MKKESGAEGFCRCDPFTFRQTPSAPLSFFTNHTGKPLQLRCRSFFTTSARCRQRGGNHRPGDNDTGHATRCRTKETCLSRLLSLVRNAPSTRSSPFGKAWELRFPSPRPQWLPHCPRHQRPLSLTLLHRLGGKGGPEKQQQQVSNSNNRPYYPHHFPLQSRPTKTSYTSGTSLSDRLCAAFHIYGLFTIIAVLN